MSEPARDRLLATLSVAAFVIVIIMPKLVARGLSAEEFEAVVQNAPSGSRVSPESDEAAAPAKLAFFDLFRYATILDWSFIVIACLASFTTGYCQVTIFFRWHPAHHVQ